MTKKKNKKVEESAKKVIQKFNRVGGFMFRIGPTDHIEGKVDAVLDRLWGNDSSKLLILLNNKEEFGDNVFVLVELQSMIDSTRAMTKSKKKLNKDDLMKLIRSVSLCSLEESFKEIVYKEYINKEKTIWQSVKSWLSDYYIKDSAEKYLKVYEVEVYSDKTYFSGKLCFIL